MYSLIKIHQFITLKLQSQFLESLNSILLMQNKKMCILKEMNIHTILYCLVKLLNCVVYEHVLIEKVTEEVEKILTAVNVNRVFTQSLMLILFCFIEVAKISFLNIFT